MNHRRNEITEGLNERGFAHAFQATPVEVIRVLLQDQFWPEQITYNLNMAWLSLSIDHTVVWDWKLFGIPSRLRSTVSTDTNDKS